MSNSAYYNFRISDLSILKELKSQAIAYDNKKMLKRNIASGDGKISISLSDVGTAKAFFITSTKNIDLAINETEPSIVVTNFLFMEVSTLTSLSITCSDASGSQVEVIIWGVD